MIEVNGQYVTADISDIVTELKRQCELNGKRLFYKSIDTPKNYMICCPFHKQGQERKPSMGILKSDGTCHCFACGWVGSIQELVSNVFGYDDLGLYGSKWIVKNFLTLQVEQRSDIDLQLSRKKSTVKTQKFVSEEELDSYRWYHPYWAKRGITDENIIELFDLGYDKKTDCITFNCRDKQGNTLFVAKRSVKNKWFNYPKNVEKHVYGIYELYKLKEFPKDIYITESMLDCLSFWQVGKFACALNGLGTALQFEQLRQMPNRHFILATDNDEAGMKARMRLKKELSTKLLTEVFFPNNKKDANECSTIELENLEEIFV